MATVDLDKLKELEAKATPVPWRACGEDRGGCQCCAVWDADAPVLEATKGAWGDSYPAIRVVQGDGLHDTNIKIEAYMEHVDYGEVPLETGKANALFIVAVRNALPALIRRVEQAKELVEILRDETAEPQILDLCDEWLGIEAG